jgi:hypothetical protein
MQNLINKLGQSRVIPPSPAAIQAAKVIQELHARANQDTQARMLAESKLTEAYDDIERLTKELQDAKNIIDKLSATAADAAEPSVPEATSD